MTTGTTYGGYNSNGRGGDTPSAQLPSFGHATGFGAKGYDQHDVDAWVQLTNGQITDLTRQRSELEARIEQLEAQKADLSGRVRGEDDVIQQSVSMLTTAQQTADATVKTADEYSGKVMQEARSHYDTATRQARDMVAEANRLAKQTAERVAADQAELQRQTVYLKTLLDSVLVNVTSTLEGTLRYVADEFGHSATGAVEAATQVPSRDEQRKR